MYIDDGSDKIYVGETNPDTTGLGDVVLVTAIVKAVNKKYPEKKIILRLPGPKTPFLNNPRIYSIEDGVCGPDQGVQTFGKTIEQIGGDGFYYLDENGNKRPADRHHTTNKCRWFGIENANPTPELFVSEEEKAVAEATLKMLCGDRPAIFLCRNSTMPQRDWVQEGWIKVVDMLTRKYDVFQVEETIRYNKQTKMPERVMTTVPNARQEFRGYDVRKLIALMSVSRRYLGVNTGFMPIATAFGSDNVVFADNRCAGDGTWLFPQNTHIWNFHSVDEIMEIVKNKWML